MRTSRSNGIDTYTYLYSNGLLTQMTRNGRDMFFAYDAMGMPATLTYRGIVFFYVTNLQGDVIAILDGTGTKVVEYAYDAWGNTILTVDNSRTNLAAVNPLRYRGYIYDGPTGCYYLQRY